MLKEFFYLLLCEAGQELLKKCQDYPCKGAGVIGKPNK